MIILDFQCPFLAKPLRTAGTSGSVHMNTIFRYGHGYGHGVIPYIVVNNNII